MPPPAPAPRPVPLAVVGFAGGFLLLFGGIWAFVGLVVSTVFTLVGGPIWDDWILDHRGVEVRAKPTAVVASNARVNRVRVQDVHLRYEDPSGTRHDVVRGTTDRALIAAANAGEPLSLEIDPERPTRARLVGERASLFGPFVFLPLAFFVAGLVIAGFGARLAGARRALYRDGRATEAKVVAIDPTSMRQNRRAVMKMRYAYSAGGASREGHWATVRPSPVGATIWVLFDPSDPDRSIPADV